MSTEDELTAIERLQNVAQGVIDQIEQGEIPEIEMPTRTKSNIEYSEEDGVWVYGDKKSYKRADSKQNARKLLQTAKTIEFIVQQMEEDRSSTLRELYYLSEGWEPDEAQFSSQDGSNDIVEDLEVISGVRREEYNIRPEESGATLIGPLKIREQTRSGDREIHCQEDVGEGGYQIPTNPDMIEFIEHDMDFAMCVETGGMRDRLVENGFDKEYNCLIIHLKGQPSRSTRRITKRIHQELDIPITVFTDADPWSYRIFGSVSYGSIKSAHLSKYLATPDAQFIGVRPSDIRDYDLPSDSLADSDINALESIKEDPRFDTERWHREIDLQLEMGTKAEQQSLASEGLDFVTETYLPERLEEMGMIE